MSWEGGLGIATIVLAAVTALLGWRALRPTKGTRTGRASSDVVLDGVDGRERELGALDRDVELADSEAQSTKAEIEAALENASAPEDGEPSLADLINRRNRD